MQARSKATSARRRLGAQAVLAAVLTVGFGAPPLAAQYISPGSVSRTHVIPAKEQFDESVGEARWRLGPVRLAPWIGLRDASFVSSEDRQAAAADDFTLTAGAGLRAYLPSGKMMLAAHALPEYAWWQDSEDKRSLNGRFGLGLFGYFNRLRLEVSQRRVEQQAFYSDEVRELTSTRSDFSNLVLELDVARRLAIYGSARRVDFENEESETPTFSLLDREEESFELGLRYRSPRGLSVSLGWEESSAVFDDGARNLSNSGSSRLLGLGFESSSFNANLTLQFPDVVAEEGSEFGAFDETTGSLDLEWSPVPRLDILTYARRVQRFSLNAASSFNLHERQGARVQIELGRTALGLIGEIGDDEYNSIATGEIGRVDDVTAYGAEVRLDLDLVSLTARLFVTEYDSDSDEFDREVTVFGFGFELGALIEKLRLGFPPGTW